MVKHENFRLKLLFAAPLASLAGLLYLTAFPGIAWWPGAFIAIILFAISIWRQKARHGLLLGTLFGAFFWLPLIDWLTLYLGPVPWLALSSVMVLWFALFGASIALVTSKFKGFFAALAFAGLWVAREAIQSTFPYDGFAWGRLAHTQADGPLVTLVPWLGFSGFSGVLALLAVLPVAFAARDVFKFKFFVLSSAVISLAVLGLSFVPVPKLVTVDHAVVAAVQGNSKSGVFDDRENGDVIASHLQVTKEWISKKSTTDKKVDAIIWPENSAEFNLPWSQANLAEVRNLVDLTNAYFVVGSVLGEDIGGERHYTNSSLVLSPESNAMSRYDKRHPVPFAEYMPHRSFYRALAPSLVDLVQLEYDHGTTSSVLPVSQMQAGIAICFDIIFDDHASLMNKEGAQVIFAQTNNADFGQTDQSLQQLAIAKLRAVEMGRDLINISTVATSEIVSYSGHTLAEIEPWQPGVMSAEIDLREGSTPAMRFGAFIAGLWVTTGFSLLVLGVFTRRRIA